MKKKKILTYHKKYTYQSAYSHPQHMGLEAVAGHMEQDCRSGYDQHWRHLPVQAGPSLLISTSCYGIPVRSVCKIHEKEKCIL